MDDRDAQISPDDQPAAADMYRAQQAWLKCRVAQFVQTARSTAGDPSAFVVDGKKRLDAGVWAAASKEIEAVYEMPLRNAGSSERQRLLEEMEKAIAKRAEELMPPISPESLF